METEHLNFFEAIRNPVKNPIFEIQVVKLIS